MDEERNKNVFLSNSGTSEIWWGNAENLLKTSVGNDELGTTELSRKVVGWRFPMVTKVQTHTHTTRLAVPEVKISSQYLVVPSAVRAFAFSISLAGRNL